MSPRRPVKTRCSRARVATAAAHRDQSDFAELRNLVADIRVRLDRLSEGSVEPVSLRLPSRPRHTRPYRSPARVEAEALYRLAQNGRNSVNDIRNLITVPPRLEQEARNLPSVNPAERKRLIAGLKFRRQVLEEFENLVANAHSANTAGTEPLALAASAARR